MGIRRKKTLIEHASDYVDQVRPQVEQAVVTAKDRAVPLIADARDKAVPVIEDARDRAKPLIADGAAIAAATATQVADLAQAKAAEGREAASAKVAELKGEKPEKGGRLKKVVLLGGLAAGAAWAAAKLRGGQDSANWNSSYTPAAPPTPAPTEAPTPAAPQAGLETDDPGGSSPDEALADAAETPHAVTTPDAPADEVVIDDTEGGAHKA